jgi:histidine triad (HIT) family protein
MFNHEPPGYRCPLCAFVAGGEDEGGINRQSDVVRRDPLAMAYVAPKWWPNNHGHVLVVPTAHHENLYDLPPAAGHAVHDLVRDVATAIRETYGCDGTSVRQHNEPGGNQEVWHYHVHVYPRYEGDDFYRTRPYPEYVTADQRLPYAQLLRARLSPAAD